MTILCTTITITIIFKTLHWNSHHHHDHVFTLEQQSSSPSSSSSYEIGISLTKTIWINIESSSNLLAITVDSLYLDYPLFRTSLYFEQKARSLRHLCTLQAIFISLSWTSLSWIFLYLQQKSWSLATISLSSLNFFSSKGPFTQEIEQKCLIFENSNVIKTFEIRKFD